MTNLSVAACQRLTKLKSFSWICLTLLGFFTSAIAQGTAPDRRWSIRKTGEFGRKIDTNKIQEIQLPVRQFRIHEPNLDAAETRLYDYDQVATGSVSFKVKRPSLNLEVPQFGPPGLVSLDQEAQETEEHGGYSYPIPDPNPDPLPGHTTEKPDPITVPPELPDPVDPSAIDGSPIAGPFRLTDEDIDSTSRSRKQMPPPSIPEVTAGELNDEPAQCTDDNDPKCWEHGYNGLIPGEAGTDYPILAEIVPTSFNCEDQQFSGYYADTDEVARCQMFHICLKRNKYRRTHQWSFLCPNGTLFSQSDFVCVWWADAPECNGATVRSLYDLNEQLGWDNITEGGSGATSGFGSNKLGDLQLQAAMSAMNHGPAAFRPSAPSRKNVPQAAPSNTRTGNTLPYRVPVKVNGESGKARTKLQEVTQNALHAAAHNTDYETEHEGNESNNFETSLRQQSESQRKSKLATSSSLHKSTSEAYELKGSAGGIQPLIVNRPRGNQGAPKSSQQVHDDNNVVMMPSLQRYPDGSEGYDEVPVKVPEGVGETESTEFEGYRYPKPTSGTPAPTYLPPRRETSTTPTTENFPPPTIPTEPPLENYESGDYQATTEQEGYQYPNPSMTTEESEAGYVYPKPSMPLIQGEEEDEGYNYPSPSPSQAPEATTEREETEDGYQYSKPSMPFVEGGEDEADYPTQVSTERAPEVTTEGGYHYQTTRTNDKLQEQQPEEEEGYQYTTPSSMESETTEEEGYRYNTPKSASRLKYTEQPTVTEEATTAEADADGYNYPTPKESEGYNYPSMATTENEVVTESTETTDIGADYYQPPQNDKLSQSVTTDRSVPSGGYLPPPRSKDIGGINAEQLELDQDTVGISGDNENDIDYEDDNDLATHSTGSPSTSPEGYGYNHPTPSTSDGAEVTPLVLNGGALDSDEKVNEILKQIQEGGIEAVDGSGNPIEFSKLKELLLNSPRGSVEIKGDVDSLGLSSTEIPMSPQVLDAKPTQSPIQEQPPQQQPPRFDTVSTARIVPDFNNKNFESPSGFYLPPNGNNNNAPPENRQPQYYNLNPNNSPAVRQPSFDIKLPNREYETHSVENLNSIDNANNPFSSGGGSPPNGYQNSGSLGYGPQQQQPQRQQQQQYQSPNQQFFQNNQNQQNLIPNPTLSTSLVIPSGNYLPPSSSNPQSGRQVTSSILQSQYYSAPAAGSASSSSSRYLSAPIQLTENIELQQSFARPLPLIQDRPLNGNRNPLNPRDINIVPALFVHQHTSVAGLNGGRRSGRVGGSEDSYQNLDTAQSAYLPEASTSSRFSSRSLLSQLNQLNQIAATSGNNLPKGERQFTRRSNSKKETGSSSATPTSSHTIEKAQRVTTFTLEDARTPDELQQYHHQDLKRFHSENIAKQGSPLDDVNLPEARTTLATAQVPVVVSPHRQNSNGGTSAVKNDNDHANPGRFSLSSDDVKSRGRSNHEAYFIPVSGSFTGSDNNNNRSSSSNNTNRSTTSNKTKINDYSQFRLSGRGRESRGGGRSDYENESTLLSRFLPEEEGGFGSRLLSF